MSTSIKYVNFVVYKNSTKKHTNQFSIGYMVSPTLNGNKVFRYRVEKCFKDFFYSSTMSGIKNVSKKDNTCVIAIVMFYENRKMDPMKVIRGLICVVYSVIDNYVCIDYLGCQYKKSSVICSDKIFADMSYNELLGIGIP